MCCLVLRCIWPDRVVLVEEEVNEEEGIER
jgi:hypothetical protein